MTHAISVIGLGKLGAPMAACFAAKGFRVVGVDMDEKKVESIGKGRSPIFEPHLSELLASSDGLLRATGDIEEAVLATDVTFIVVATPTELGGGFSLRYVLPVCERIGKALSSKSDFHVIVLTSTVMPGSTGGPVKNSLELASGKLAGQAFGLCYNPEFIALGSVIRDFQNPDFLLIGESDTRSGEILELVYRRVCENNPPTVRMSFANAEIAKLAVNAYVTTKISFANMLARICERMEGANVDAVTSALALDSRIGPKYLKGAVSYGGPCFPRDNLAMTKLAHELGAPADIAQTTDRFNRSQVSWLADLVQHHLPQRGKAGILGFTYKPDTDVVEEAAGFLLMEELLRRGVPVVAFDPSGKHNLSPSILENATITSAASECVELSDVVVISTPWIEFHKITRQQWGCSLMRRTVIDCWRMFTSLKGIDGVSYVPLGMGGKSTAKNELHATAAVGASSISEGGRRD